MNHPKDKTHPRASKRRAVGLALVSLLTLGSGAALAKGRKGSTRGGGKNAHGKGAKYKGGK